MGDAIRVSAKLVHLELHVCQTEIAVLVTQKLLERKRWCKDALDLPIRVDIKQHHRDGCIRTNKAVLAS